MDKKLRNIFIIIVVVLAALCGVFYFLSVQQLSPSQYDDFAKCLKDKGAVFYGAFWCVHCQKEKALFGNAKQYLPYVECSTPDSNSQLKVCADQNIKVYPTWTFADGSRKEGELSLQELAEKTGCVLPK